MTFIVFDFLVNINLKIMNYFVGFGNYALSVSCWQHKHVCSVLIVYKDFSQQFNNVLGWTTFLEHAKL